MHTSTFNTQNGLPGLDGALLQHPPLARGHLPMKLSGLRRRLVLLLLLGVCLGSVTGSQAQTAPEQADVSRLVEELASEEVEVREYAALALGELGASAAPVAVEPLIVALQDEDAGVRSSAAEALGWIGPTAASSAVPALIAALQDEDAGVRSEAAWALGEMGPEAASDTVVPLTEALKSDNAHVRSSAALALEKVEPGASLRRYTAQARKQGFQKRFWQVSTICALILIVFIAYKLERSKRE